MSVAELQKRITRLTPAKRRALAKYALFLERLDSPARRQPDKANPAALQKLQERLYAAI